MIRRGGRMPYIADVFDMHVICAGNAAARHSVHPSAERRNPYHRWQHDSRVATTAAA